MNHYTRTCSIRTSTELFIVNITYNISMQLNTASINFVDLEPRRDFARGCVKTYNDLY